MLIGGALGNVVDRLFRGEKWLAGAVVDFIDLQWFPVFNIADSAVTVGAAILIFSSLASSRKAKQS
jgi:signal peptidase II